MSDILVALEPFSYIIERLKGNLIKGSYGAVWEALPALDFLMKTLEEKRQQLRELREQNGRASRRAISDATPLEICYQNAWLKLQKYNNLTDESHEIYAAATLLNPCFRKSWFKETWTGNEARYIPMMIEANRGVWERDYRQNTQQPLRYNPQSRLDAYLANARQPARIPIDEFTAYVDGPRVDYTNWSEHDLFSWWMNSPYP